MKKHVKEGDNLRNTHVWSCWNMYMYTHTRLYTIHIQTHLQLSCLYIYVQERWDLNSLYFCCWTTGCHWTLFSSVLFTERQLLATYYLYWKNNPSNKSSVNFSFTDRQIQGSLVLGTGKIRSGLSNQCKRLPSEVISRTPRPQEQQPAVTGSLDYQEDKKYSRVESTAVLVEKKLTKIND